MQTNILLITHLIYYDSGGSAVMRFIYSVYRHGSKVKIIAHRIGESANIQNTNFLAFILGALLMLTCFGWHFCGIALQLAQRVVRSGNTEQKRQWMKMQLIIIRLLSSGWREYP